MDDPDRAEAKRVVIAIPARNEEARIGRCLRALGEQIDETGTPLRDFFVVLLINNTHDRTRDAATAEAETSNLHLTCIERTLDPAQSTAGWARRFAMEEAADQAGAGGIILTTDADSRPQPHWLSRSLGYLQRGADAVAGEIDWDPDDPAPQLSDNRKLELRYAEQCAELVATLDPIAHDPWPNHRWAWGASLAVTVAAYRQVGGIPAVDLAEDRAFQALLLRHDLKVRHARDVRVWTSGRTQGRAPGGLADLIRSFADDETTLCDALLEPPRLVLRKAALRGRLRRAWTTQSGQALARYAARALGPKAAETISACQTFGQLWQTIEHSSPAYARRRVDPKDLATFSNHMRRLLQCLHYGAVVRSTSRR